MASIYKKTYTKPLPDGAETFTRKGQRYAGLEQDVTSDDNAGQTGRCWARTSDLFLVREAL